MERDAAVELAELVQQAASNTRRIESLERGQEALNRLTTAVEVLATKQDSIRQGLERLGGKVDELEQKPARRWEGLLDKILLLLAGAFVSFLLARGGICP